MATITRYVNPDSTAGGDGTTNATSGANRAYVSLSAWEAAEQQDLDTGNNIAEVICETGGTADTTLLTIDGWTTSATDYIDIKTSAGHRHAGVWNTAKYRLSVSGNFTQAIDNLEANVRITGLQVENTSANPTNIIRSDGGSGPATGEVYVVNCLLRDSITAGLLIRDATYFVRNCAVYQNTGLGISIEFGNGGTTATVSNCTVHATGTNAIVTGSASNTTTLQNCYAAGSATADYSSNFDTITTCASEDGSQSTTTVAYDTASGAYFTNITGGSEDYHLQASSSLINAGTDLSGSFTDDFDSVARSGTWDIGADEYVAVGGVTTEYVAPVDQYVGVSGMCGLRRL